MAGRPPSPLVQLKVRVRKELRERLEQAALASGRPTTAETVERLERSFTEPPATEAAPELENMARLMAAAFVRGGQRGAHARGHPEWAPAEWLNDSFAYDTAVAAVLAALDGAKPVPDAPRTAQLRRDFAAMAAAGVDLEVREAADQQKEEDDG